MADEPSVRLFRRGLHLFASLSGLHANPQKSQLILSKAAQPSRRPCSLHWIFRKGIFRRIQGWDGIRLSFAGRVQLIKSVLMALETHLRDKSLWTVTEGKGSWGWRKLLKLRLILQTNIQFCVGDGMRFFLWHDPWHTLGPLILRYPRGPQLTGTCSSATLSLVLDNGQWRWPLFTDISCSDIVYLLPPIHPGTDRVTWRSNGCAFSTSSAYDLFRPPGPKVGWSSLLLGSLKIPRNSFILWLVILGKLSTLDKPWLLHFGGTCVLCMDGQAETHDHLFFACSYSRHCLAHIREHVRFPWPHIAWERGIEWASARWRGKHVVNATY
ncbi:UNVERIFIED_CONTAM: hypothetical protein Slati_3719300 [Sesamum latifolium]|uniref:Reverse transcriptase zinc-binding domain-containing protein n=1 Tax=Sesamum latifolium TaxID=2727402 RepID=A0AAW2U6Q9_9LAMI